jgi:hypothetical protein
MAFTGRKRQVLRSDYIESGGPVRRIGRSRKALAVGQALQLNIDHVAVFRSEP